jgi:hypothetical protein
MFPKEKILHPTSDVEIPSKSRLERFWSTLSTIFGILIKSPSHHQATIYSLEMMADLNQPRVYSFTLVLKPSHEVGSAAIIFSLANPPQPSTSLCYYMLLRCANFFWHEQYHLSIY